MMTSRGLFRSKVPDCLCFRRRGRSDGKGQQGRTRSNKGSEGRPGRGSARGQRRRKKAFTHNFSKVHTVGPGLLLTYNSFGIYLVNTTVAGGGLRGRLYRRRRGDVIVFQKLAKGGHAIVDLVPVPLPDPASAFHLFVTFTDGFVRKYLVVCRRFPQPPSSESSSPPSGSDAGQECGGDPGVTGPHRPCPGPEDPEERGIDDPQFDDPQVPPSTGQKAKVPSRTADKDGLRELKSYQDKISAEFLSARAFISDRLAQGTRDLIRRTEDGLIRRSFDLPAHLFNEAHDEGCRAPRAEVEEVLGATTDHLRELCEAVLDYKDLDFRPRDLPRTCSAFVVSLRDLRRLVQDPSHFRSQVLARRKLALRLSDALRFIFAEAATTTTGHDEGCCLFRKACSYLPPDGDLDTAVSLQEGVSHVMEETQIVFNPLEFVLCSIQAALESNFRAVSTVSQFICQHFCPPKVAENCLPRANGVDDETTLTTGKLMMSVAISNSDLAPLDLTFPRFASNYVDWAHLVQLCSSFSSSRRYPETGPSSADHPAVAGSGRILSLSPSSRLALLSDLWGRMKPHVLAVPKAGAVAAGLKMVLNYFRAKQGMEELFEYMYRFLAQL